MKTSSSTNGFLVLALVVISSLQVNGCMNQSKGQSGSVKYQSTLFLDYLQELLKDDDTTTFTDEARSLQGTDAPTIQDLTDMFNDMDRGEFPKYMEDRNYNLVINATSTFNYSTTNTGTVSMQTYGVIKSQENAGTASSLEFSFIQGSVGTYKYTAGTCFYIHSRFTKSKSSANFETSILASTFFKIPDGPYVSSGNFTGIGQGNAVSYSSDDVSTSVKTLGIFHNGQYYSKNVMTASNKQRNGNTTSKVTMVSLTGGTNSTINFYSTISPQESRNYIMNFNGTLRNSKQKATLSGDGEGKLLLDLSEPFMDTNLFHYFGQTRIGADVYLS